MIRWMILIVFSPTLLWAQSQQVTVVDQFDKFPLNALNQEVLGFFDSRATIKLQTISGAGARGRSGHSLQVDYQIQADTTFCGFTSFLPGLDLSNAHYLSFWIKGNTGGEYLSLELTGLGSSLQDTISAKVALWDYLPCGPALDWQKVMIPLDAFWNLTKLDNILQLTFLFEAFQSAGNGSPLASTIFLDDLLFGSHFPGYVKIDGFNDQLKSNATGANTGEFSQNNIPENYTSKLTSNDLDQCDNDLLINYDNDNGDTFGGIFFILGGQETGWKGTNRDLSRYDHLHLRMRAQLEATNPGNIKIEMKPDGSDQVHFRRVYGIETMSRDFDIPLDSFMPSIGDIEIGQLLMVFEANRQSKSKGSLLVETIELRSEGYKAIPSAIPPPASVTINGQNDSIVLSPNSTATVASSTTYDLSSIESAYLEYYDGCEWVRFEQIFAPLTQPLSLSFTSEHLIPNRDNVVRLVVQDYQGHSVSSEPLTVQVDDPEALSAEALFHNAYRLFEFLRTETDVYADAARFQGPQGHPVSVATTGMGLVTLCIADAMGWENQAELEVIQTLEAVNGLLAGFKPERNAKGWFRHFIDAQTGARAWDSEFSSIDSGILTAGALFCKEYFSSSARIAELADALCSSIHWESMIKDPDTGAIYLTADAAGVGGSFAALPFNEYMLVAWLAKNDPRDTGAGKKLWDNFFEEPVQLPTSTYAGFETLTDGPGRFLSGFIPQFTYYLCHPFNASTAYGEYFSNHMQADTSWWRKNTQEACYVWGFGAGSTNDWVPSGYHADDLNSHPGTICSPHIMAGAIPVLPEALDNLLLLAQDTRSLYQLPGSGAYIPWRFSAEDPLWRADAIQGVDFATFLFGIAAHPDFLGKDFFLDNTIFRFPDIKTSIQDPAYYSTLSHLKSFPNPFSGDGINIEFSLDASQNLHFRVINLSGKTFYQRHLGLLPVGEHRITWSGKNDSGVPLPAGLYILQVEGQGGASLHQIKIIKHVR